MNLFEAPPGVFWENAHAYGGTRARSRFITGSILLRFEPDSYKDACPEKLHSYSVPSFRTNCLSTPKLHWIAVFYRHRKPTICCERASCHVLGVPVLLSNVEQALSRPL